jgi:hypothetical protein
MIKRPGLSSQRAEEFLPTCEPFAMSVSVRMSMTPFGWKRSLVVWKLMPVLLSWHHRVETSTAATSPCCVPPPCA